MLTMGTLHLPSDAKRNTVNKKCIEQISKELDETDFYSEQD